jgi:ubiquinone/menaquinone biosynthesis C-methylase UbiE
MHQHEQIVKCYDQSADDYSQQFLNELENKPFDRLLLAHFANENSQKGLVADLGCGPGQTTKFLYGAGMKEIIGIDLSEKMIEKAANNFPDIKFEAGNMLHLRFDNASVGGIVAFYAIVHFSYEEIFAWLKECYRVLKPGAQLLFSFHAEEKTLPVEEFLGKKVSINWYFFDTNKVVDLVKESGLKIIDVVTRYPYPDKEHPSMRTYIVCEKG